jgi:ABC-2 type transport system permease protein
MNITHFKWLVKREYWEHKGGFFWAPAIISILMAIFLLIGLAASLYVGSSGSLFINGQERVDFATFASTISDENRIEVANGIASNFIAVSIPVCLTLGFVAFFYCLSALYDDRKDRSILFWKSLPTSDSATVLSKVFSVLIVAPFITICMAIILSYAFVFLLMVVTSFYNMNIFGVVLSNSEFYTLGLSFFAVLPVYLLWSLPTVGYLLMVSAWARRVPLIWAVGIPVIGATMVSIVSSILDLSVNYKALWALVGRLLLSTTPGSWFAVLSWEDRFPADSRLNQSSDIISASYATLSSPHMWIGVVFGIAMIFIAIRLRRWRDDS